MLHGPPRFAAPALSVLMACSCQSSDSGRPAPAPARANNSTTAGQKAMQDPMMAAGTPGPEHDRLRMLVGTWDLKLRSRTDPSADWTTVDGTMTARALLGGRFVTEELHSTAMGMPFEGFALLGYDRLAKCYTSLWTDSFSTWTISSTGLPIGEGVVEFHGRMVDFATPQGRPFRSVETILDDDHWTSELLDTVDGREIHMMTLSGTRRR